MSNNPGRVYKARARRKRVTMPLAMFSPPILKELSFKAVDDRYCREFEINADSSISKGVACRIAGQWQVEVLLAAGQRSEGALEYQPASGYSEGALSACWTKCGVAKPSTLSRSLTLLLINGRIIKSVMAQLALGFIGLSFVSMFHTTKSNWCDTEIKC